MRKVFAICLALTMLLPACAIEERMTIYVVTEQRNYVDGVLSTTTSFQYDSHGRPIVFSLAGTDGSAIKTTITYDKYGNRTRVISEYTFPDRESYCLQIDYVLTYTDGRATHCDFLLNEESQGSMDMIYDDKGQLIQILCDETYSENMSTCWWSFTYDKNGRLIDETTCQQRQGITGTGYPVFRTTYGYDEGGNLSQHHWFFYSGQSCPTAESKVWLDWTATSENYDHFHYNSEGKLDYIENERGEKTGGQTIYRDPAYTFDQNGNVLSYESGSSRIEYTYQALRLTQSEAQTAKMLMQGVTNRNNEYEIQYIMDPLHLALYGKAFYGTSNQSNPFYYWIPYPMWQINH